MLNAASRSFPEPPVKGICVDMQWSAKTLADEDNGGVRIPIAWGSLRHRRNVEPLASAARAYLGCDANECVLLVSKCRVAGPDGQGSRFSSAFCSCHNRFASSTVTCLPSNTNGLRRRILALT